MSPGSERPCKASKHYMLSDFELGSFLPHGVAQDPIKARSLALPCSSLEDALNDSCHFAALELTQLPL